MTLVGDSTKISDAVEIDISDHMLEMPFLRPDEIETIKRHKKMRDENKKKTSCTIAGWKNKKKKKKKKKTKKKKEKKKKRKKVKKQKEEEKEKKKIKERKQRI